MNTADHHSFPIRCLAYTSQARESWSAAALHQLADDATARNLALAITGRLLFLRGRFIQVLEGPGSAPRDLFDRIQRDPRHTEVALLFDAKVQTRSFPNWRMDVTVEADLTADQAAGLPSLTAHAQPQSESYWNAVLRVIRGIEHPRTDLPAKAAPRQSRGVATMERLAQAAQKLMLAGRFDTANMQTVATEANVSLPTAYRYFSSPEQLIAHLIKRWQARQLAAFAWRLAGMTVQSELGLATEIVGYVIATYMRNDLVPLNVRMLALRNHHRIAYAELWDLAAAVGAALVRNGLRPGDAAQQARVAMALAGLAAQAKMAALQQPEMLDSPWFRAAMTATLADAMRG